MLCVEGLQVFNSTIEVFLLVPAYIHVSQARPTSAKREESGELCIQAVSCVRYNHNAVFCHMTQQFASFHVASYFIIPNIIPNSDQWTCLYKCIIEMMSS